MTSLRPLSPELAEKAVLELNEVPNRIPEDLEALRTWIAKQPHLNARTDDQFLIAFLRGCKYSLEKSKEKIDNYYTIKSAIPEFFDNRDPNLDLLKDVMSLGVNLPLPYSIEPASPRFVLVRMGCYDATKYSLADIMKVCYMITDILISKCDTSIIAGHIVLVDLRGVTFSTLSQVTFAITKKMTTVIEALPIRTKGIHFINPSAGFDALFKLFKGFLSAKIQSRIFVHESFEALHKEVPKKFLPEEYGGCVGSIQSIIQYWTEQLIDNRPYFLEDAHYRTNEKKRVGAPKNAMTLFGVDGSFRSLDFD